MLYKVGMESKTIGYLQMLMGLPATNVFSSSLKEDVIKFQQRNGLVPDGLIGNRTFKKIVANAVGDATYKSIRVLKRNPKKEVPVTNVHTYVDKLLHSKFRNTQRNKEFLIRGFETIAPYLKELQLDTSVKRCYFLGQVYQEVGRNIHVEENLNYSPSGLRQTFKIYRNHFPLSKAHGRTRFHRANQVAIANNAYANRYGNGSVNSGDGWRFRGMGFSHTTFRSNVEYAQSWLDIHIPKLAEEVDFTYLPNSRKLPRYALLLGAIFWADNNLGNKVGHRVNRGGCTLATATYNKYTSSYDKRWKNTQEFAKVLGI